MFCCSDLVITLVIVPRLDRRWYSTFQKVPLQKWGVSSLMGIVLRALCFASSKFWKPKLTRQGQLMGWRCWKGRDESYKTSPDTDKIRINNWIRIIARHRISKDMTTFPVTYSKTKTPKLWCLSNCLWFNMFKEANIV